MPDTQPRPSPERPPEAPFEPRVGDTPPDAATRDAARRDDTTYPAERARQGEIILRSRRRKAIFFGGLLALVLFAMIWTLVVGAASA